MTSVEKGLPLGGVSAAIGLNLLRDELPSPVAILKESALANNGRWMTAFREKAKVELCPHGKTTMSPELFARQLGEGAWGITCSTAQHLEVCRDAGVNRILVANQLVGRANLAMVLRHLRDPACDIYVLVDSVAGVDALASAACELGLKRPATALLEVGDPGGRTGVRTAQDALAVAERIAQTEHVSLAGLETFEGIYGHHPEGLARADTLLGKMVDVGQALDRSGAFARAEQVILSAGGTDFFDRVAVHLVPLRLSKPTKVVIRSGCYVTNDHLHYAEAFRRLRERGEDLMPQASGLVPALEVWAHVQSMPEPGLALCSLGKRDISYDWDLPTPLFWARPEPDAKPVPFVEGYSVQALNDQHAFLTTPADTPLRIGDLVGFGVSHPCTTFDKWRHLSIVDDRYNVMGGVSTRF